MTWWRTPTITVARFTLRSYFRSGWILGDIVFVWLLYAAFFLEFDGNVAYFFGTVGQGLIVLAVLGTIVMVQRGMNAQVYLPLARLSSRSAYVRGLILATGVMRVPLFLLMLVLAIGYHRHAPILGIEGATLSNMLPGAIGNIIICMITSTLTVVLSVPIATRRIQIVFLAWLAAMLYSYNSPGIIEPYLVLTRLPFAPIAACSTLGITGGKTKRLGSSAETCMRYVGPSSSGPNQCSRWHLARMLSKRRLYEVFIWTCIFPLLYSRYPLL